MESASILEGEIIKTEVGGRGTYFSPTYQVKK